MSSQYLIGKLVSVQYKSTMIYSVSTSFLALGFSLYITGTRTPDWMSQAAGARSQREWVRGTHGVGVSRGVCCSHQPWHLPWETSLAQLTPRPLPYHPAPEFSLYLWWLVTASCHLIS